MADAVVTVRFNRVLRVTDESITIRADSGKAITISAPFDKTLQMQEPWNGMGMIKCPARLL